MMSGHSVHWDTMTLANEFETAWLLHRRPYRNTSLIADFLTVGRGRVSAVVRGGQQDPNMQAFRQLYIVLSGKTDLMTVRKSEPATGISLGGNALFCGLYVNELLVRLLHPHDPVPGLPELYQHTLQQLQAFPDELDIVLRQFEFSLLEMLGYGVCLDIDAGGQPVQGQRNYLYLPEQGLVTSSEETAFPGEHLLALSRGEVDASVRVTAKRLARAMLAPHLGGKPLMSRSLFMAGKTNSPNRQE